MASIVIARNGNAQVVVPAGQSIVVNSLGTVKVVQIIQNIHHPATPRTIGDGSGSSIYGPFTDATSLIIYADGYEVLYSIGVRPVILTTVNAAPVSTVILTAATYDLVPYTSTFVTNAIGGTVTLTLPDITSGTITTQSPTYNGFIASILNDSDTHVVNVVPYAPTQLLNGNGIPVVIPAGWGANIYGAGIADDAWAMSVYPVFQLAEKSANLPAANISTGTITAADIQPILINAGLMNAV